MSCILKINKVQTIKRNAIKMLLLKLIKGDGNSSIEDISDISGEMDHLNPLAPSVYRPKRRRSTAITERFGVFLSPWGKIISDP